MLFGGWGFVDDLVGGWYREDGGFGFATFEIADGDDLFAGAGIIVFDDHVDGEVGRVPILVDDYYLTTGAAHRGRDDVGFANAGKREATEGLCADVFLLEVGVVDRSARGDGVGRRCGRLSEDGLSGETLVRVEEDAEAAGGIVDVRGEEWGLALEVGGDELTAFVVDASGGGARDVRSGGAGVHGAVGEVLVGEDLEGGAERDTRHGRDEDAGNDDLDAAIVARHLLALRVGDGGGKDKESRGAGAEEAHENLPMCMRIAQKTNCRADKFYP